MRRLAKAQIDKSSRFTDWSRRPLTDKQLAYALSDVTHLRTVYSALKVELDKTGREPWLEQEMAVLTSPATYNTRPEDAWKRLHVRLRSKKQLARADRASPPGASVRRRTATCRASASSRTTLSSRSQPRCRRRVEALGGLRALPNGFGKSRNGAALIAAVKEGLAADPKSLPAPSGGQDEMSDSAQSAAEILKLALKIACEREGIATKLVASSADIDAVAADDNADVPLLKGWRHELFGKLALDLKARARRDRLPQWTRRYYRRAAGASRRSGGVIGKQKASRASA